MHSAIKILALACVACHAQNPPPPQPPAVIDAAADVVVVDAARPGPVTVLPVKRGPALAAPIVKQKFSLSVRSETEVPNAMVPRETLPSWLPSPARADEEFHHTRAETDTVLAQSRHTIVAFDKAHQEEVGLDFEPLRGDLVRHVVLGGDHSAIDRGTVVSNPRRLGGVLLVVGSDMERDDMSCLLAVDLATATTFWKTAHDVAPAGFEIVSGHAIASSRESGHWALDIIELDTGRIVQRVPTTRGPYRLELLPDGSIRGHAFASEVVTPDGKSFAIEIAVTPQ